MGSNGIKEKNMAYYGNWGLFDQLDINVIEGDDTLLIQGNSSSWRVYPFTLIASIDNPPDYSSEGFDLEWSNNSSSIRRESIKPGTSFVIPANTGHRFPNTSGAHNSTWLHVSIALRPNMVLDQFYDIPLIITGEKSREIKRLSQEIIRLNGSGIYGILPAKMRLYMLVELILSLGTPKVQFQNLQSTYHYFLPLLEYIEQKQQRVSLQEAAKFLNCSVSKLQKDFRALFGMPIGEYILSVRLRRAARLLTDRSLSCAAIAEMTGFSDSFAFSRMFKRRYMLSPREYRNSHVK